MAPERHSVMIKDDALKLYSIDKSAAAGKRPAHKTFGICSAGDGRISVT